MRKMSDHYFPGDVVVVDVAGGLRIAQVAAVWSSGRQGVDLLEINLAFRELSLVVTEERVRPLCDGTCPKKKRCVHCRSRLTGPHAGWCLHGEWPDIKRVYDESGSLLARVAWKVSRRLKGVLSSRSRDHEQ